MSKHARLLPPPLSATDPAPSDRLNDGRSRAAVMSALASACALVAACGGGGTGGIGPVSVASTAGTTAARDATVNSGDLFSFQGSAHSPDNKIEEVKWTVASVPGTPALQALNADCAVNERTERPILGNTVSSDVLCRIQGRAPTDLPKDAVYELTFTAKNAAGSISNTTSVLKVSSTFAADTLPRLSITGPASGTAGQTLAFGCAAEGGTLAAGASYRYEWLLEQAGGTLSSLGGGTSTLNVRVPNLSAASAARIHCRVTDSAGKTGWVFLTVTLNPAPVAPAPAPAAPAPAPVAPGPVAPAPESPPAPAPGPGPAPAPAPADPNLPPFLIPL